MDFIKLPSITNHHNAKSTRKWISRFPAIDSAKYILTEKLDGSSFQIIISADEVKHATRNRVLELQDSFYDWQRIISNNQANIDIVQNYVKACADIEVIHVYGEIFGRGIQKRIDYGDNKMFLPFEVRVNHRIIPIKDALDLFETLGIPDWWVPIVAKEVTLEDALTFEVEDYDSAFAPDGVVSKVEGVVIAPYDQVFADACGSVFRMKKKSKMFNDKMKVKHKELVIFEGSDEYVKLQGIWDSYFCPNRLLDLFSKEGMIESQSEIGKFIRLMGEDVREEFFDAYKDAFIELTDAERKRLMSTVGPNTLPLLREHL
jgi:Rnl2 family RNA ligase